MSRVTTSAIVPAIATTLLDVKLVTLSLIVIVPSKSLITAVSTPSKVIDPPLPSILDIETLLGPLIDNARAACSPRASTSSNAEISNVEAVSAVPLFCLRIKVPGV